jgi:hypothetical protein
LKVSTDIITSIAAIGLCDTSDNVCRDLQKFMHMLYSDNNTSSKKILIFFFQNKRKINIYAHVKNMYTMHTNDDWYFANDCQQ